MKNNETLTKGIIDHNMNYHMSETRDRFLLRPIILKYIYTSRNFLHKVFIGIASYLDVFSEIIGLSNAKIM